MRIIISVLVILLSINTVLAHGGHEHSKSKLEGIFSVLEDKNISIDTDSEHIANISIKKAKDKLVEYKLSLKVDLEEGDDVVSINKLTTTYDNFQKVIYYNIVNFANDKTYSFMINFKNFDGTNNGSMTVFSVDDGSFTTESITATVESDDEDS